MSLIDERCQPEESKLRSTDEILMHKLTNAGTQNRIPQEFTVSTFGVRLKTLGASAAQ